MLCVPNGLFCIPTKCSCFGCKSRWFILKPSPAALTQAGWVKNPPSVLEEWAGGVLCQENTVLPWALHIPVIPKSCGSNLSAFADKFCSYIPSPTIFSSFSLPEKPLRLLCPRITCRSNIAVKRKMLLLVLFFPIMWQNCCPCGCLSQASHSKKQEGFISGFCEQLAQPSSAAAPLHCQLCHRHIWARNWHWWTHPVQGQSSTPRQSWLLPQQEPGRKIWRERLVWGVTLG